MIAPSVRHKKSALWHLCTIPSWRGMSPKDSVRSLHPKSVPFMNYVCVRVCVDPASMQEKENNLPNSENFDPSARFRFLTKVYMIVNIWCGRGPVHDITTLANEASDVMGSGWRRLIVYLLKS